MKNIEKYRNLIAKGEVDALLLTSKHNRMYAAEYCVAEGVSVICKEESYYFTDFCYIEAAQKNLPGFTVVMTDADHPYTKLINDAIAAHTVKTLGFEDDSLTVEEYTLYNTKLNAVLHPYSAEINAPRQSKEPWEIEYMKKAQEITDRTFEDLLNIIRPGMTEKELCAELIYRLYKFGSEGPSFDPITISGPNTSLPHGVPSERELQYGDFVTMDFGCLYHGYCSDMTRTIALGYVSEKMDKVYHTVLEAQLAGIAATKAGVTGKAMDAAARKVIDDAGFVGCFGHSYGHSLGLLIHEAPNASMRNDKPMPAGAVVSAEPGIYIPDEFGVRIEDDIADPARHENFQNTIQRLLELDAIPIINENDTVSVAEFGIGDNDTLSAIVATSVRADLLVLLSDIDGLYTADPHKNPDAQRIDVVPEITDDILRLAEGKGSELGTGGMKTKLSAAQIVTKAGTDMIIANGADVEQLYALLDGRAIGTRFTGKKADA